MTDLPAAWFDAELASAAADFHRVYEAHYDEIQAATLAVAEAHPEFGPLIRTMPPEQLEAQNRESRERLRAAFQGDWASYEADLRAQGALYAAMGISFRGWRALGRDYTRLMVPRILEAYGDDPQRLARVMLAMHEFLDRAMATLAEAYLDTKQELVLARERDLAVTLDSIGDAVIVTDEAGRIVRMNPVAEKLTGRTLDECRTQPLAEIFRIENEITGELAEDPVARVLREGVIIGLANHTVLVTPDGRRVPIADSAAPVRSEDGALRGVVLVFHDMSEERSSEKRTASMVAAALDCIIVMDDEGVIREFNPAAERTFGHKREDVIGEQLADVIVPERLRQAHRSGIERYLGTREPRVLGRRLELPAMRADGSEFPAEISVVAISAGAKPSFAGFVRDLSEQKLAMEARARSVELEAENRRVLEASRLKSEFLANMSHELRTPLNSIIGFGELLHDGEVGPLIPKQREFLSDILTSGRHLLQLINDVLDLSKVEAGRMEFHPEAEDLAALVHEAAAIVRPLATPRQIELEVIVGEDIDVVVVDGARIKQILYNYLSNAIKFTADGGRVRVRALGDGAHAFRLEVEDNGIGIAPEDMGRLFVEFQQLDSGRAKRQQGTGLGLALTRRLAEAMGGTVGVSSKPGVSTVFHAVLPRKATVTAALPLRRRVSSLAPGIPLVLVVEDDAEDQACIVGTLIDAGYAVETASTVSQALALCRMRAYDAVTLDLLLPDGSGLDVLRALRSTGPNRHVPVVVITVVADKCVSGYVVDGVLPKPIEPSALLDALRRVGAAPGQADVLVVDDDPGSLKLMAALLEQLGYEAACFRSGETALRAIPRLRPRAVVLDLIMPEMDGFRFLELFRRLPEHAATPVLVWTVKDLSAEERAELESSAHGFLPKGRTRDTALIHGLRDHLALRKQSPTDSEV